MKIDHDGRYRPFPGLTIVSSIQEGDQPFWQLLHSALKNNQNFTAYFSPLPYESYHITTTYLSNQKNIGEANWRDFVEKNQLFFQSMSDDLIQYAFHPFISIDESIQLDSVLQLRIELPVTQINIIHSIASKYGLQKKVPSEFHMTLAYQYKYLDQMQRQQLTIEVSQLITSILNSHESKFYLNPPTLCYFHDMTKFTPWNGVGYPFSEPVIETNRFFSEQRPPSKGQPPEFTL